MRDLTLRTLVTPGSDFLPLSAKTGEGIAPSSAHDPRVGFGQSGWSKSGKIPYSGGRLPVRSRMVRADSRIACRPLVTEYKLHKG
jgi:hypothetical protein